MKYDFQKIKLTSFESLQIKEPSEILKVGVLSQQCFAVADIFLFLSYLLSLDVL